MSTSRIGGPTPPESNKPQSSDGKTSTGQHRKVEKVEKIREVSEVDDETKRRKFEQAMEEADETDEEEEPLPPSPFQKEFYLGSGSAQKKKPSLEEIAGNAVPSPSYSPPPPSLGKKGEEKEEGLPHSVEFWDDVDEPPDQPPQPKIFEEVTGLEKSAGKGEAKSKLPGPKDSLLPSPQKAKNLEESKDLKRNIERRAPARGMEAEERRSPYFEKEEKQTAKKTDESTSYLQEKPKREQADGSAQNKISHSRSPDQKETSGLKQERPPIDHTYDEESPAADLKDKKKQALPRQSDSLKSKESKPYRLNEDETDLPPNMPPPPAPLERSISPEEYAAEKKEASAGNLRRGNGSEENETVFLSKKEELKDEEKRAAGWKEREKEREKKGKKWAELESMKLPYLNPSAAAFAAVAMNQVNTYLNPDTFALFYQMVGTIFILTQTRGVSKTDFVLNSPAYANSRFYGATITIEKYATAPDSLNIRLTGTDEAVKAFNQNLPSLMNAFKNGNFAFKIGRLEVEYTSDKPSFGRKEEKRKKSDFDDER